MKRTFILALICFSFAINLLVPKSAHTQSSTSFIIEGTDGYNTVSSMLPLPGNRFAFIVSDDNWDNTYLRIFNSAGLQTADINITSRFNWPHTYHYSTDINAISMGNGNIFITYAVNSNSFGIQTYNAQYLVLNDAGITQTSGQLNSTDAANSYIWGIQLAKLSDGKIVAVWNRAASANYVFRLFNADGTTAGNDLNFIGPGTASPYNNIYTCKLAAGKNGNFMFSMYYYGGDMRGFVFDNNGNNVSFNNQPNFVIDPTIWVDYANYGIAALSNGNFAVCWGNWNAGINYVKILAPDGSTLVGPQVISNDYTSYTDVVPISTPGSEGFMLAEARRDQSDMSNPYTDLYIHLFNQSGVLQSSTVSNDGAWIQPTLKFATIPGGGYFYTCTYYKNFMLMMPMNMAMATGDQDIQAIVVSSGMGTLPVSLVNYDAKLLESKKVLLSWRTASEINNSYFQIEKSIDGRNFTVIGRVNAKGSGNTTTDYSFTDGEAISGNTYYRLKQFDIDSKSKDLGTKLVKISNRNTSASAYPNPVQGNSITLVSGDQPLPVPYRLSDAQGRTITTGIMNQTKEEINIHLSEGIYFLQIGKDIIKIRK